MIRSSDSLTPLSADVMALLAELHRPSTLREKLIGRTAHDLAVLDELATAPEPLMIPYLLDAVFTNPGAVSRAAAGVVDAALTRTPLRALSRLEDECRRKTWYSWPFPAGRGWHTLLPVQLAQFHNLGPTELAVAAVASFHPNGHVREAAVDWLDTLGDPATPYLLLRLNDWVDQVAERARAAMRARLARVRSDMLVHCLPLLAALDRTSRRDHSAITDAVRALLREPAQQDALARGRQSPDPFVRRVCFQLARESAGVALTELFRESRDDPDPAVRLAALADTVAAIGDDQLEGVVNAALTDTFAPVRRIALDAAATRLDHSLTLEWLDSALLDRSRSVRDVARHHLARLELPIDVVGHYRDSLLRPLRSRTLAIALAGLRETGGPRDAELALGLLHHERPIVRRAAVRTVAALDVVNHLDRLVAMLHDPSPTVATIAAEEIRPHASTVGLDAFRVALRSAPGLHNRVATASLAFGLGKWNSLLVLLETADGSDAELKAVVDRWLRDWLARQNRAYSQPTTVQLESIRRALAANGDRLEGDTRQGIEQTVAYWSPK